MKKLFIIFFSLILVLVSFSVCFAEQVIVINPYTGEIVNQDEDYPAQSLEGKVRLSGDCIYSTDDRLYVYNSGSTTSEVKSSVVNGMVTTDSVSLVVAEGAKVGVYLGGEELPMEDITDIRKPGAYIVRDTYNDTELLRFTIVHKITCELEHYTVPSEFYISEVYKNGERAEFAGNTVSMTDDAHYVITYGNDKINKHYTLDVTTDRVKPSLVIYGLNDKGYANSTVSFGEMENNSSMTIERDGEFIVLSDELKEAGDYRIVYTDEAGNSATYYFTIRFFLDAGGWIYVALLALVAGGAVYYYFYSRKHVRKC